MQSFTTDFKDPVSLRKQKCLESLIILFSYSSRPRPLQARRKYRNEVPQETGYRNLMFDRRIVRGNTYAREDVLPVTAQVRK